MEPEIETILRAWRPKPRAYSKRTAIRPGTYTLDTVPRSQWDAYIAEHRRVKALGIVELKPVRSDREHVVYVVPIRGAFGIGSFSEELRRAAEAKAATLARERDLERHLGVLVDRWDRASSGVPCGLLDAGTHRGASTRRTRGDYGGVAIAFPQRFPHGQLKSAAPRSMNHTRSPESMQVRAQSDTRRQPPIRAAIG